MLRLIFFMIVCLISAVQGKDFFELPPISYTEGMGSDAITRLAGEVQRGEKVITAKSTKEFLRWMLKELKIPEESQVLVFSKTSLQIRLISPQTPRALYFNDDIYVGWVPGGKIEIAATDPVKGMTFYTADFRRAHLDEKEDIFARETSCLSCHATTRTEGIPGVFVRSVFPDKDGQPLGHRGSFLANDSEEMKNRWGGYYITGRGRGVKHMGNRIFPEKGEVEETEIWHDTLEGVVDTDRYLQPTSDIIPLMMLEHQTRVHNRLIRANLRYRRIRYLVQTEDDSLKDLIRNSAEDIVKVMIFQDEATIGGDGMDGNDEVEDALIAQGPLSLKGRSLRETRLHPRLMVHRMSYMIYSEAFANLPHSIKSEVLRLLRLYLSAEDDSAAARHLGKKEKSRIDVILRETFPPYIEKKSFP